MTGGDVVVGAGAADGVVLEFVLVVCHCDASCAFLDRLLVAMNFSLC